MPQKSSAIKRHKQSLKNKENNRSVRSTIRTANKRFLDAVKAQDAEAAGECLHRFEKIIDTAAGKGIYKKNTAARKKSRMRKLFNSLGQD